MAKTKPTKFPGNLRPAVLHGGDCAILILPVVRLERVERPINFKRLVAELRHNPVAFAVRHSREVVHAVIEHMQVERRP